MTFARRGSRRLFLAIVPFFRQTKDDSAVALTVGAGFPLVGDGPEQQSRGNRVRGGSTDSDGWIMGR
jgi:hypothetical protein